MNEVLCGRCWQVTILAALPIMQAAEAAGVPVEVDAMARWYGSGHCQVLVQAEFP